MKSVRIFVASAVALAAVAFYPSGVTAHHSWGKYHWARAVNPLQLTVASSLSNDWEGHFTDAVADWEASTVLSLTPAYNAGKNPLQCAPTLGRIDVCNAEYGTNGWLGIAQIWISGGSHIAQAITKLNDTYFKTAQYNTSAWRQFVMCQEVGHDFGLDHQDENFNNRNLGTCMDYTSDPDGAIGGISNLSPNTHDYEQLVTIYTHLDTGGSPGGGGGGRGRSGAPGSLPVQAIQHMPGNNPGSWGRMVASNGRLAVFVLDLGNGNFVITHVLWA